MTDKLIQIKDANGNNLYPCVDYNNAANRPSINNVPLVGNKTSSDLGINNGKTLLWTNSSPTVAFNAQTITLNKSANNFDVLMITMQYMNTNTSKGISFICTSGTNEIMVGQNNGSGIGKRDVTVSGQSVTFSTGKYNGGNSEGTSTAICIPIEIYGIIF